MELPELPPLSATPKPQPPARAVPAVPVPPAAALQRVTIPQVSPTTAAQFQAFEQIIGGRAALVAKLALVASSKDEDYIVGLLSDPKYDSESLAGICRVGKISLSKLLQLYRDAALTQAQVGAIDKVAARLPDVAKDVMDRATEHRVTCQVCQGTTKVTPSPTAKVPNPQPEQCRACAGYGSTITQPDHETQKTALELGGLLKKGGGGLTIQQTNVQANLQGGSAGFDDLVEKMDELLFGNARDRVATRKQTEFVDAGAEAAPPAASEGEILGGESRAAEAPPT